MRVALLLLACVGCFAADRLYLKDGSYQTVREYQVQSDRIRYYSTERGDWEEIPLELVDLDRTKKEKADEDSQRAADAKEEAEERAAVKTVQKQIASIPGQAGVYLIVSDEKLDSLTKADLKIVKDKKRMVWKALSPIPMVPGKATVELDGEHSQRKINNTRPEFFFRLSETEEIEIIRMTPKKEARVAETLSILSVQNEKLVDEQVQSVPTFKKQEDDLLYRIWPIKPLEPGEYALIQFTAGKMSPQIWDFSITQ